VGAIAYNKNNVWIRGLQGQPTMSELCRSNDVGDPVMRARTCRACGESDAISAIGGAQHRRVTMSAFRPDAEFFWRLKRAISGGWSVDRDFTAINQETQGAITQRYRHGRCARHAAAMTNLGTVAVLIRIHPSATRKRQRFG
jgi:hypothetical protein